MEVLLNRTRRILVILGTVVLALGALVPPANAQGDTPSVIIDSPASNSIFTPGDIVSVTSSLGSPVGIAQVNLLVDGAAYGLPDIPPGSTPPPAYKTILRWTAVAGTHVLTIQGTDSENRTAR